MSAPVAKLQESATQRCAGDATQGEPSIGLFIRLVALNMQTEVRVWSPGPCKTLRCCYPGKKQKLICHNADSQRAQYPVHSFTEPRFSNYLSRGSLSRLRGQFGDWVRSQLKNCGRDNLSVVRSQSGFELMGS